MIIPYLGKLYKLFVCKKPTVHLPAFPREVNLSVSTIIRIFDLVSYPKAELPKVLSIDEFKGNTWVEKYQCILTDPENKIVLDILPERYKPYLITYFCKYPKEEREKVKYFVSDTWRTYYDTAGIWFKNAIRIVDKTGNMGF